MPGRKARRKKSRKRSRLRVLVDAYEQPIIGFELGDRYPQVKTQARSHSRYAVEFEVRHKGKKTERVTRIVRTGAGDRLHVQGRLGRLTVRLKTQRRLAKRLRVDPRTIRKWRSGERGLSDRMARRVGRLEKRLKLPMAERSVAKQLLTEVYRLNRVLLGKDPSPGGRTVRSVRFLRLSEWR